ncbi:MAG: hypothetical protein Q9227_005559 [Pyrenula ochraceoflavens]
MSDFVDIFATDATGRRERPRLFPWNRRLRHLLGVSVRNINVVAPLPRSRGRTITDDDVPAALQSPTKLLAQREANRLKHSSSSTDLKSPPKVTSEPQYSAKTNGKPDVHTLSWSATTPFLRQQRLKDAIASTMADSWFSIHCNGVSDPVYISEVIVQSLNPSFQNFDLNPSDTRVTRSDELTVKIWARTQHMVEYILLVELACNLQSLQFVGKRLESFHHPLPQNCVLFHLTDGIYTSFTDMPANFSVTSLLNIGAPRSAGLPAQYTSSFDALMRLANLDECRQDALATKAEIEAQMNIILEEKGESLSKITKSTRSKEKDAQLRNAINVQRRELKALKAAGTELHDRLTKRKTAMNQGRTDQERSMRYLGDADNEAKQLEGDLGNLSDDIHGQTRRICEDLLAIFPIEPVTDRPLQFTIRGLALPNSNFDDIDREVVAAALGHTAQVVQLLSIYLSVPLPYPVRPYASHSYVEDPVSNGITQRTFPLHPGSVQYRFEYAVFLLNKDIEFLMNKYQLRMIDIRHTLPNLKYLLYVATSGRGELPARKAGGIKGLITGRLSPSISRQASEESVTSTTEHSGVKTPKEDGVNGVGSLVSRKGKAIDRSEDDGRNVGTFKRNVPLRASALRESF